MMKPTKHLPLLLNTLPRSLLLRAEIAHKCTHRGDLTWLYCEAPKNLSFQMTQIPEAFHFVSSIIINLSFLFFFQGSLCCRPTAWLSVWVIHQPALCELCKNMHTCSASYFLSGPNTWSDQSPKKARPGNWVLLNSWLGRLDIGGWMCSAPHPPREKTRPCRGIQETPDLATRNEREAPQIYWTRSRTTCDFTSNYSSSPTKQEKTENHSPSYIKHTQKEFFKGKKNKPGSIFEGKRLFIAAKVLGFFFPCLWQLDENWRLQQRRDPFTCHHIEPLCSTEEMAKFHP